MDSDRVKEQRKPQYWTNRYKEREKWIGTNILRKRNGNSLTKEEVESVGPFQIDAAIRGLEYGGNAYSYNKEYTIEGKNAKAILIQNLQDAVDAANKASKLTCALGQPDEHAKGHALRIKKYNALIQDLNADNL